MPFFHVVRTQTGPEWDAAQPLEGQSGWVEHAALMDDLVRRGVVVFGGPLPDRRVAFAVQAENEDEVEAILAHDNWTGSHLLTESVTPWELRLAPGGAILDLIERYNAAWNAQDLDAIDALHHDEIVFHNHTADERAEGKTAVREHIGRIFANNPDLSFRTRSLGVSVGFAVCEWTATAGGKEWDGVDVFPLRDGLILRKDVYSASHRPRARSG
ncbi:MAG TPA: nuclear transport factor 2 family protein [Gaiellaceae bacterium]|nr:nuclear transport factor 2 family protein [Gaiellaceae bacterium]